MAFIGGGSERVQPTSPNAPQFLGTMHMQRSTLLVLLKQFNKAGSDEVICNIAGWDNSDANGPILTVEVFPRFVPKKPQPVAAPRKSATLHAFF
jgi:hypothetical protein